MLDLEHLHADPHDVDLVAKALGARSFDVAVVMYGRLHGIAALLAGKVGAFGRW